MSSRSIRIHVLTALAALLVPAAALNPSAAAAAPRKAAFDVKFQGDAGALWYVKLADGEPHHPCLAGDGAEGSVDIDAATKGKRTVRSRLYLDQRQGHVFGRVPLEVVEHRSFTMGGALAGCDEDYAESAGRLDCEDGSPQWGLHGNPPAWLDVAAGRGTVAVGVSPEKQSELIDHVWNFCPFWGQRPEIGGRAKLSTRALLSGRPQTVKGRVVTDRQGGDGEHAQEGVATWKLTIRYLKPRRR